MQIFFFHIMTSSEALTKEIECDFSDLKPIEIFEYPSQASKLIWDVNSNNILQTTSQIIDFIKNNRISIQMALYLINIFCKFVLKKSNYLWNFI